MRSVSPTRAAGCDRCGRETSALHYVFERKGPQVQSKTITQAPKKDIGVTVVVRHDTVPKQSDIKISDRPKTQRERDNVRDVPSGSWPVLIDRGIKTETCTN